jgi:nitrogen fixation-related uncharacterized protein
MSNEQLYLAIGVPILFNALLYGLLWSHVNIRFDDFRAHMDARFEAAHQNLLRVEGVVDTRLKSLEDRLKIIEEARR